MKDDERQLWDAVKALGAYRANVDDDGEFPRQVAKRLGINWKRACYLLGKWARKGWYEYGVSVDLGWMTPEGMSASR